MHDVSSFDNRDLIAIVGIACRLPGAANPGQLWDLLIAGRDTVGQIPPERFDIDEWFDPLPGLPGRIATRSGGFVADADQFDAQFFGMSGHEAIRLDPQHRLMLLTVWEAIEDAGLPAGRLAGSRTGVYTSCLAADYWDTVRAAGLFDMHAATGTGSWGLPSGRISHLLDLRGPSMGVEATCASSLLAVHLACQDLWAGETEMAIVSGANLLLAPDLYLGLSEAGILSPGGRSRFGEATVDGYVRSEGAISLVFKPLTTALRDGDRIYATIRGTGVTNNGSSSETLIAPGVVGQEDMLRRAYQSAGTAPSEVDYVEAHGAGTPRGDEVELTALNAVLGDGRPADQPCLIGSIKSNIGHTETIAGLAGLLKAALSVHHRTIPATLHVRTPHPALADSPLELVTEARPWPDTGRPAVAAVSSFGLSATNVHVVLSEAAATPEIGARIPNQAVLLPLSAKDSKALTALGGAYADHLEKTSDHVVDVSYTAGARRTHHGLRAAVVGRTQGELAAELRSFATGARPNSVVAGGSRVSGQPKIVFVFPGQGSQWVHMGRQLLDVNPAFRDRITECSSAIEAETGWSLVELLRGDEPLESTDVIQPALWAMAVGLAAVWREWGIEPDLVIGHSMGEIAAATVAGSLSIPAAAAVVCRRSALITRLARPGSMVVVHLSEQDAREAIGEYTGQVSVGVLNSSHNTVLAGDPDALDAIVSSLRGRGVFCRQVKVGYASHAPQVEPLRDSLLAALSELRPSTGQIPMHSTLYDREIDGTSLDASYWMANLREPVLFGPAVRAALATDRPVLFVEVSPHPVLIPAIEDTIEESGSASAAIGSLMRDSPELESLLSSLATAYVRGCEPNWEALYPSGRFSALPTYPWQTKRYWVEHSAKTEITDVLTLDSPPSSVLDAVFAAAKELGADAMIEDMRLSEAPANGALRTVLRTEPDGWQFDVRRGCSRNGSLTAWTTVASGRMALDARRAEPDVGSFDLIRAWCQEPAPADGMRELWRRDGEAVGTASSADLMDACARTLAAAASSTPASPKPLYIKELRVLGALTGDVRVHARLHHVDVDVAAGDIRVLDHDNRTLAEVRGLRIDQSRAPVPEARLAQVSDRVGGFLAILTDLLRVTPEELSHTEPLASLGMDSLIAARLRNRLMRELGVSVTLRDLLGPRTVAQILNDLRQHDAEPSS